MFEKEGSISPKSILKLDQNHNTGPYWHIEIKNLNVGCIYAFRIKQKNNGINNNYEKKVLLDLSLKNPTSFIRKEMSKINKVKNLSHLLCFINFQIYFLLIT